MDRLYTNDEVNLINTPEQIAERERHRRIEDAPLVANRYLQLMVAFTGLGLLVSTAALLVALLR